MYDTLRRLLGVKTDPHRPYSQNISDCVGSAAVRYSRPLFANVILSSEANVHIWRTCTLPFPEFRPYD